MLKCKIEENIYESDDFKIKKEHLTNNIFLQDSKHKVNLKKNVTQYVQEYPNIQCKRQNISDEELVIAQIKDTENTEKKGNNSQRKFKKVQKLFKRLFHRMKNLSTKNQILKNYLSKYKQQQFGEIEFNQSCIGQTKSEYFRNKISNLSEDIVELFNLDKIKKCQFKNLITSIKIMQEALKVSSLKNLPSKDKRNKKFRYLFRHNQYISRQLKQKQQNKESLYKSYLVNEPKIDSKMQMAILNSEINFHPYYSLLAKNISKNQFLKSEHNHQVYQNKTIIKREIVKNSQKNNNINQNNIKNQQQQILTNQIINKNKSNFNQQNISKQQQINTNLNLSNVQTVKKYSLKKIEKNNMNKKQTRRK